MTPPDDFGQMPTRDFSRIQGLCDQLEQAWKEFDGSADGVDLEPLLKSGGDALRLGALYELIKTEMPLRYKNGLDWDLNYYLKKYPELGGPQNLSPHLILEECLVRKKHGIVVSLPGYKKRFPEQFAELEKLLQSEDSAPFSPLASPGARAAASPAGTVETTSLLFGLAKDKTVAGRFLVQKRLGKGAYGEVWQVRDTKGDIEKALKVIMHSMDSEEGKTELAALDKVKNLDNPFILRPDSYWVEEGRLLIVMELARGGSLRDCLKKRKQEGQAGIPMAELLRYIREAADALDYLHDQKIVHRDIKPDNILLVGNHAKVADMGLAKPLTSDRSTTTELLGSAPYMAPEVWKGRVSRRSDQYSLVVTYVELRQGTSPFKGKTIYEFGVAHVSGNVQLDRGIILEEEREVILKGLAKNRGKRYISCLQFVEALEQISPERRGQGTVPARVSEPAAKAASAPAAPSPTPRPSPPLPSMAFPKESAPETGEPALGVQVLPEAATAFGPINEIGPQPPGGPSDSDLSPSEFHKTETPRDTAGADEKRQLAQASVEAIVSVQKVARVEKTASGKESARVEGLARREDKQKEKGDDTHTRPSSPPNTGHAPSTPKTGSPGSADIVAKQLPASGEDYGTITAAKLAKPPAGPAPPAARPKPPSVPPSPPPPLSALPVAAAAAPSAVITSSAEGGIDVSTLKAGQIIGNLLLSERLGGGSFAEVWKVLDKEGGVDKAIRIIKSPLKSRDAQDELKRFETYKNLTHPFLIHTDSHFQDRGRLIIVMELVDGISLRQRLNEVVDLGERGIPLSSLLIHVLEVAQALDYLHAKNIVHRDIKPDNILLSKDNGHAKVADLGLAKLIKEESDKNTLAGTPAYMALEVLLQKGCFPASDQYSLAATYAELRQGEIASQGGSPCLREDVFGKEERRVLEKALASNHFERYPTCVAFVKALEETIQPDALETTALPVKVRDEAVHLDGTTRRPPNWYRRAGVFAVLGLLIGVMAAIFIRRENNDTAKNVDYESIVADARKLDPDPKDRILSRMKDSWLSLAQDDLRRRDFLSADKKIDPELPVELKSYLKQHIAAEWKAYAESQPFTTIEEKEKAVEIWSELHAYDSDSGASKIPKQRELVDSLLRNSRTRLWKPALASLRKAAKYSNDFNVNQEKDFHDSYRTWVDKYIAGEVSFKRDDLTTLESLDTGQDKVFRRVMTRYIKDVVPTWPERGGWKTRFQDCAKADPEDPLVQACVQECLLEDADLLKHHGNRVRTDITGNTDYTHYVRGISKSKSSFADAAACLEQIALKEKDWFVKERRDRAVPILQDAAKGLRNAGESYKTKIDAERAYKYLDLAVKWLNPLKRELPDTSRVELAMAALLKPGPNWELGSKLADLLKESKETGAGEKKFFRLVTAPSYQMIREEIRQSRSDKEYPFGKWKLLLQELLALGETEKRNPEVAQQYARWLAAKGWLLHIHQDLVWDVGRKPKEETFDAFARAYDYAIADKTSLNKKEQVEFLCSRIIAEAFYKGLEEVTEKEWKTLKQHADLALDRVKGDPTNPSSHTVQAFVLLHQARLDRKAASRLKLFEAAHARSQQAYVATKADKDEHWAYICFLRSVICLELGNLEDDAHKKSRYIEEARDYAKNVRTADFIFPSRVLVCLAHGHALEDVELLLGADKNRDYNAAVNSFKQGLQITQSVQGKDGNRSAFHVALGRCYYRWAKDSQKKHQDTYLGQAQDHLKRALGSEPRPKERAEAHYWLGKCRQLNGKQGEAEFKTALAIAEKHNVIPWIIESRAAICDMGIEEAYKHFKTGSDKYKNEKIVDKASFEACLKRIEAAEEGLFADNRKGDYLYDKQVNALSPKMANVRAQALRWSGDADRAWTECNKGLGNLDAISADHLLLYELKVTLISNKEELLKDVVFSRRALEEATKLAGWLNMHREISETWRDRFVTRSNDILVKIESSLENQDLQTIQKDREALRSELGRIKKNKK